MAITKEITTDKIEVVGNFKHVQVRTVTIIKEDGVELSRSYHRHVLDPTKSVYTPAETDADGKVTKAASWTHADTDISKESTEVQAIANAVWTDEVKKAYKAHRESTTS
tara:strand:- start:70 stop:396 length:327 start_codon:yes stop_codon:yes gene_type:complete